ncbi:MAG: hypothetical protein ABL908_09925 [Hyphomicrobium sp.]
MAETRRDVLTAGAMATLSALTPGAVSGAFAGYGDPQYPSIALAYRHAFADFEAAVRPSSEVYWNSHNRAVADIYARDKARHRSVQD